MSGEGLIWAAFLFAAVVVLLISSLFGSRDVSLEEIQRDLFDKDGSS